MSCCCNPLRHAVSQRRRRLKEGGFDLDLTYLTVVEAADPVPVAPWRAGAADGLGDPGEASEDPSSPASPSAPLQPAPTSPSEPAAEVGTTGSPHAVRRQRLIAMSFPATGLSTTFRNRYTDVKRFLDSRHPGRYRVYNLCVEQSHQYKPPYDFCGDFVALPMTDHNPGALMSLLRGCRNMRAHLSSPDNIAVIHCKAGKGRTGMVVCCYKLYSLAACWDNLLRHQQQGGGAPYHTESSAETPSAAAGLSSNVFGVGSVSQDADHASALPVSSSSEADEPLGVAMADLQGGLEEWCPARAAASLHSATPQHIARNCDEVLREYAAERTVDMRGVTIPSQIRFVRYFGDAVWEAVAERQSLSSLGELLSERQDISKRIRTVAVSGVSPKAPLCGCVCGGGGSGGGGGGAAPFSLLIQQGFPPNHTTATFSGVRLEAGGGDGGGNGPADGLTFLFDVDLDVAGEYKVAVLDGVPQGDDIVHAWLHAGCEGDRRRICLQRPELDVRSTAKGRCRRAAFTITLE